MVKKALLIGVSECKQGLSPLLGAIKDVEEMKCVLEDEKIGGFESVQVLQNPERQDMEREIERFLRHCASDDLVLLYFSGHAINIPDDDFYFTCSTTEISGTQELYTSTAVAASSIRKCLEERCPSKRKVVILDCCFSGAFAEGRQNSKDGQPISLNSPLKLEEKLGGKGRAILTSSGVTETSRAGEGLNLSLYTRYLVEGLETGKADLDGDDLISVEELHQYACEMVISTERSMNPEIHIDREGDRIFIAKAVIRDPRAYYSGEIQKIMQQVDLLEHVLKETPVEIPSGKRPQLDFHCKRLQLDQSTAKSVEDEILEPFREQWASWNAYVQTVRGEILQGIDRRLPEDRKKPLKRLQNQVRLSDQQADLIERRLLANQWLFWLKHPRTFGWQTPRLGTVIKSLIALIFLSVIGYSGSILLDIMNVSKKEQKSLSESSANSKNPIERFLSRDENSAEATEFFRQGEEERKQGNCQKAIEAYSKAIELYSNYANAYYTLAGCKDDIKDSDGAIEAYKKAIEYKSSFTIAHYVLGLIYYNRKDYEQSIKYLSNAIQINRDWSTASNQDSEYYGLATAYRLRGDVYRDFGKKDLALADYNRAIEIKPDYVRSYLDRASLKADSGDYETAVDDYNQAVKLKPSYFYTYYVRGLIRFKIGDAQGAINDYNQAIKLKPDYAEAWFNRAYAFAELNDCKSAIDGYTQTIKIQSNYSGAYNNRGNCKRKLQNNAGALDDFSNEIRLYPNNATSYQNRADLLTKLGEYSTAILDYEKAALLYQEKGDQSNYQAMMNELAKLK